MIDDRLKKYNKHSINSEHKLAYLLQICRRNNVDPMVHRNYIAEKIIRAARTKSELILVCELNFQNLDIYDECLELIREESL